MIHGFYLLKHGQAAEAVKELEEASKGMDDDANLHYNLGLAYLEIKDFDRALAHAHEAYRLGFQLEGLRRKLVAAGKWSDPAPATNVGSGLSEGLGDSRPASAEKPALPDAKAP